jgi:glycosyltransferase involved in cell wall biosynthesis
MHILIVNEYLPSSDDGEITGGVEAYCHYVGRRLARDHDVRLLSRATSGGVWDAATLASLPGRIWFLVKALASGMRGDVDVVVGTTYVVHPIAWLIGFLRRKPVVFWYADVLIGEWRNGQFGRIEGWIGELSERLILQLPVARYIAISHSTAAKLVANGVPASRITVVPCGFDPATVAAVVPERPARRRITTVGRLVPYKRVDVVLRAVARLSATRSDVELVVIGQGPESDALHKLAVELGIAHLVDFRGFVARHRDVLAAVAGSHACASASEIEGFGIVVVEAMALGVPYAVTDIPAFSEVTGDGVGGALFPPGDDEALAAALDACLEPGPGRDRLVEDGRRRAARYTWDAVAAETADVLTDEVSRRSAERARRRRRR